MREEVKSFAEKMEKALQEHDKDRGSDGWKNEDTGWLFDRLLDEVSELRNAFAVTDYDNYPTQVEREKINKECVDVANFAMFIVDRIS